MPRMAPSRGHRGRKTARPTSRTSPVRGTPAVPVNEEPPFELSFEDGDERSGRIGDPRPRREVREEFPGRRVREAGRTGGELPQRGVTADDLTRETLFDDQLSRTPSALGQRESADSLLNFTDESGIGAGAGKDEAELAVEDPISPQEHARLRERVARSGGAIRNAEPHETHAGSPGQARNRPAAPSRRRRERP